MFKYVIISNVSIFGIILLIIYIRKGFSPINIFVNPPLKILYLYSFNKAT